MKDIFSFIKSKYKSIFNGLLFLVAIVAIVSMLPREGKFKYEFQKGKPWRHETLIAPYDFPVYKNQKQIKSEKDSILENTYPYFLYDSSVVTNQTEKFRGQYRKEFNKFKEDLKEGANMPSWKLRRMENTSDKFM